jgi:hypothetical protein
MSNKINMPKIEIIKETFRRFMDYCICFCLYTLLTISF